MDKYANYDDLKQHEKEGEDYVILSREGYSGIAVIAPHGGGIEPGTVDIADGIAGGRHSFYAFKGIKKKKMGSYILRATNLTSQKGSESQKMPTLFFQFTDTMEKGMRFLSEAGIRLSWKK